MLRLYGFNTQNTLKALYVLEESGIEFEFQFVDLAKGEQRTEEFRAKAPMMKVPVLEHDGEYLFESGAICRYVGSLSESSLYPVDMMQRARVDQWMDFFSCHLGQYLTTIFFQTVIKPKYGRGEPNEAKVEEAVNFANQHLEILNAHLAETEYLANDSLSTADFHAFACVEQQKAINLSLSDYPNVGAWLDRIGSRESISRARERLPE